MPCRSAHRGHEVRFWRCLGPRWRRYGERPFGYTYNATAPGLTAAEAQKFKTLGQQMAATNGYTAEQSSGLDITDGDINDWMWGTHKILSYCFEMYAPVAARASTHPPR